MQPVDAERTALDHIDEALAKRPEKEVRALSAALRCLGEQRDGLVRTYRETGQAEDRDRLERLNAVISSVMAVQYPLGDVQWLELEKARGWLADLRTRT